MMDVRDIMPRSIMKPEQQRRIGALQAAKGLVGSPSTYDHVQWLLEVAQYIEKG